MNNKKWEGWHKPPTFTIVYATDQDTGGSVGSLYLNARAVAIEQLVRDGVPYTEIVGMLNLKDEAHANRIRRKLLPYILEHSK